MTENFATKEDFEDVKSFFAQNPVPAAQRSLQQALESIQVNISWLERNREQIKKELSI